MIKRTNEQRGKGIKRTHDHGNDDRNIFTMQSFEGHKNILKNRIGEYIHQRHQTTPSN